MPYLRFVDDPEEQTGFPLNRDRITLGRDKSCDLVLESAGPNAIAISRKHAVIVRDHDNFYLEDGDGNGTKSRNGTQVNGQPVPFPTRILLKDGDTVTICGVTFIFHDGAPDGSSSVDAFATSDSLLARLGQPNQADAWKHFVELYTPFLMHLLANRLGVRSQESADIVQEIFATLVQVLPSFSYDPDRGKFRGYLRQICRNKTIDWQRKHHPRLASEAELAGLEDAAAARAFDQTWEKDHDQYLVRKALEIMQAEFQAITWKACWETVANGRAADEVATELGITKNAVYIAKWRVIQRLQQKFAGLLNTD
jgi:RNA polymerase sigma-70 factor, ECF subfamily